MPGNTYGLIKSARKAKVRPDEPRFFIGCDQAALAFSVAREIRRASVSAVPVLVSAGAALVLLAEPARLGPLAYPPDPVRYRGHSLSPLPSAGLGRDPVSLDRATTRRTPASARPVSDRRGRRWRPAR